MRIATVVMCGLVAVGCGSTAPIEQEAPAVAERPGSRVEEPVGEQVQVGEEAPVEKRNIAAILERYRGRILYCHEKGLGRDSSLAGTVTVGWEIEEGSANGVHLQEDSTSDEELVDCIMKKIKGMSFEGIADGSVSQTWIFEPVSASAITPH